MSTRATSTDVVVVAAGRRTRRARSWRGVSPRRTLECENGGFAFGNNRGLETVDAEWVLLLNPDTEIREGTLAGLRSKHCERGPVGLVGVRQVTADGRLFPTIRRFPTRCARSSRRSAPSASRFAPPWLGERELDLDVYEHDVPCDWTSGSFMLIRSEVLRRSAFSTSASSFTVRRRISASGSSVRAGRSGTSQPDHPPSRGQGGHNPRFDAQAAFCQAPVHGEALSRSSGRRDRGPRLRVRAPLGALAYPARKSSARASLATLLGFRAPPFGEIHALALGATSGNDAVTPRVQPPTRKADEVFVPPLSTPTMQAPRDDLVSPELVLVDPDLAARARHRLADPADSTVRREARPRRCRRRRGCSCLRPGRVPDTSRFAGPPVVAPPIRLPSSRPPPTSLTPPRSSLAQPSSPSRISRGCRRPRRRHGRRRRRHRTCRRRDPGRSRGCCRPAATDVFEAPDAAVRRLDAIAAQASSHRRRGGAEGCSPRSR